MTPDARRWRRWTWLLLGWTVVLVVLAAFVTIAFGNACDDLEGLGFTVCSAGSTAGTVVAWFVIGFAWLVGFLLVSVAWFARRPARRLCPPYGHPVDQGETTCPICAYDFLTGTVR